MHPVVQVISKESLIFFYHQHDQSALPRVDNLLKHYTTEQLVAALRDKFGAEPVLSHVLQVAKVAPQAPQTPQTPQPSPTPPPELNAAPTVPDPAKDSGKKDPRVPVQITEALIARVQPKATELFEAFYSKHDPSMVAKVSRCVS